MIYFLFSSPSLFLTFSPVSLSLRPSCRTISVLAVAAPPRATSNYNCVCRRRRRRERRALLSNHPGTRGSAPRSRKGRERETEHGTKVAGCTACSLHPSVRASVFPSSPLPHESLISGEGTGIDSLCRSCVMAKKRCWPETRPPPPCRRWPLGTLSVGRAERTRDKFSAHAMPTLSLSLSLSLGCARRRTEGKFVGCNPSDLGPQVRASGLLMQSEKFFSTTGLSGHFFSQFKVVYFQSPVLCFQI